MEPFLGEIIIFGGNFPPLGYEFCNGQLLAIAENDALYSLLGTTFGGDGQLTFGLPDFRGRIPVGQGQGPGLPNYILGQMSGSEEVTLLASNMPMHNHDASGTLRVPARGDSDGNSTSPLNNAIATKEDNVFFGTTAGGSTMAPTSIPTTIAGQSQPHTNMQPYQVVNFIIATEGIYPSRN